MKSFGNINISNSYIENIINHYSVSERKDKKKNNVEEEEDTDQTEVVEAKTMQADNLPCPDTSKLIRLIIREELALTIREWLHSKMDPLEEARDKLLYLRAVFEAGYLPRLLSLAEYCEEFGPMPKSSYYDWMGAKLNYSRNEIDGVIENLPFH